jgi:hypothetical protein
MKRLGTYASALLAATLLASCGSDSSSSSCPNLGVDEVLPAPLLSQTGVWDVTYTATRTTGATVTSLQYRDSSGILQTSASPSFPFTYTMTSKPPGTRVTLTAVGTAPPGLVSLEVVAVSGPPNARETQRWGSSCGQ